MKLYTSIGPNPKTVRMFMAEKGIELTKVEVDLMGGENRREPYLAKNPMGQLPCLELDDGTVLAEITVICEYLEEVCPGPKLIGETPLARAETRMWTRRIDLNIIEPMVAGFRGAEGLEMFQKRVHVIPQAAADLKQIVRENLALLDRLMAGRTYICGDRLSLADLMLFAFLQFGARVGQTVDPALPWIPGWFERIKARPSAKA